MYSSTYKVNFVQAHDSFYAILKKKMSLILAIKGTDGIVLASDSRTINGDLTYSDNANKTFPVNKHVAIALAGDIDYILPTVLKFQQDNTDDNVGVTEIADKFVTTIVDQVNYWDKYAITNPVILKFANQNSPMFGAIITGYDKENDNYTKQRIYFYHFGLLAPQEVQLPFKCQGVEDLANNLIPKLCSTPKNLDELSEIAEGVIKDTSAVHVGVGGKINIVKLSETGTSETMAIS